MHYNIILLLYSGVASFAIHYKSNSILPHTVAINFIAVGNNCLIYLMARQISLYLYFLPFSVPNWESPITLLRFNGFATPTTP